MGSDDVHLETRTIPQRVFTFFGCAQSGKYFTRAYHVPDQNR